MANVATKNLRRFHAIVHALGLSYETDVRADLTARYGVRSVSDLSPSQFWTYFKHLQTVADANKRGRRADAVGAPSAATLRTSLPASDAVPDRTGFLASYEQCVAHASASLAAGKFKPGEAGDDDAKRLAYVLNRCREYRARHRLTLDTADTIIAVCARYPLWAFQQAAWDWSRIAKPTKEGFFYGICRNKVSDAKAAQANPHHGLALV